MVLDYTVDLTQPENTTLEALYGDVTLSLSSLVGFNNSLSGLDQVEVITGQFSQSGEYSHAVMAPPLRSSPSGDSTGEFKRDV